MRRLVVGTAEVGLLIWPAGNVIDGTRFLRGPAISRDSAMQAVRKLKFKADLDDSHQALGSVRALIGYRSDKATEIALAPAILPDSFGDRGTPRNQEAETVLPPLPCDN